MKYEKTDKDDEKKIILLTFLTLILPLVITPFYWPRTSKKNFPEAIKNRAQKYR